jgi:hypothetical protein
MGFLEKGLIMGSSSTLVIRLTQCSKQSVGNIERIAGLMPAKYIVGLIDNLDLEANPRSSKLCSVTDAIQASIREDEQSTSGALLPFKSKGILIASSQYEERDRNRYELAFDRDKRSVEGILDGGHNTLAIGSYILCQAEKAVGAPEPKRKDMLIWDDFKATWTSLRDDIETYLKRIRDDKVALEDEGISTLDFLLPVELLVPADIDDELCVESFRTSLLEICDARNNNAQLTQGTKANKEGLFDSFKNLYEEKSRSFAKLISWKTNDGGTIQSRTLVAFAWIPLSLTTWVAPGDDHAIDSPSPVSIYSGKEKCLDRYLDLMRDKRITVPSGASRRELKDSQVESALKVATDLPWLYDSIYELFPGYYSGSYGKISAVKGLQNKRGEYLTPFLNEETSRPVPEGFIYPLLYGLRAIMKLNQETNRIIWMTDPYKFVDSDAFKTVVIQYSGVIQQSDYDPQKVGKGAFSYTAAENATKLAYYSMQVQL